MDLWSLTWTMMSCCLGAFSLEVTVKGAQLMPCDEDDRVCVSSPGDCGPRASSSVLKTLNMSCYYQNLADRMGSLTCGWTQESNTESDVSLVFTSWNKVLSCQGIFNPAATLNVTARIRNHMTGTQIWSQPHSVFLYLAIKPSQPVLTLLGSTEDSVVLSWSSSITGSCQLRYRPNNTSTWTQVVDSITVLARQNVSYSIAKLQPFTVYRAAVACRGRFGVTSDWSADVTGKTLDRAPSRPSDVCYRREETGSGGSALLHLMWKAADPESRIVGYEVSISPDGTMKNVTEAMALLVVEEGNCTVTVRAFNTAGFGPAAQLRINTQRQITLLSIRNLWISSCYPGNKALLVQWMLPTAPSSAPPLTHIAVRWRPEKSPSSSRWSRVSSVTTSTIVPDLDPNESYMVSVFPIYNQQTGSPQSLSASLQQGALMEAVSLKVINVTKTTLTIMWAWQRKSEPIRVDRYSVMLRRDSDRQTLFLWSDQRQHTFSSLKPNTEYSLLLLADNVSRNVLTVVTEFDEVPTVATVIPLLLLVVTVMTIYILFRTMYKSNFFPISSPKGSLAGRWLMDPNRQDSAEPRILDLGDFQVLGEKSLIILSPADQLPSEEELHEDMSPLSVRGFGLQMSTLRLDTVCVCDAPPITEQSGHQDSETSREAETTLLLNPREANGYFPQKEEDVCQISQPSETPQHILDGSRGGYQMTSESFLRKLEAETLSDVSYLICDDKYLSNSCCRAETTEEEKTVSTA
ncbi:interleukin-6 receptor subunit beta isoform X2 [Melanotaenia boesemani]|uniref:interleukin-6 receptor subunit beta isoform X2 n=1 Tax=Melanotaenia boesemani TaxID=1250792 RepID=UPI001C053F7D|nr:interleukin-6 receptor subunit beta isoform X2 [Melanotaenia boesemani]